MPTPEWMSESRWEPADLDESRAPQQRSGLNIVIAAVGITLLVLLLGAAIFGIWLGGMMLHPGR